MKPVVLITGATGGIGEGIANLFLERGYHLLFHTHQNLKKANEFKEKDPESITVIDGDLNELNTYEKLKTVLDETGIDVLINNAGIKIDRPIEALDDETFLKVMNTNVTALVKLDRLVVPYMKAKNKGSIIHLSSGIGYQGRMDNIPYATSKAALQGLTTSLAKEVGPYNIRVNSVAPGLIPTEMTSYYSKEDKDDYMKTVPLRRLATPLDIGKACFFFASDESLFITGQTLFVNGGTLSH
jgi:3-oxoacyl-[acyl-carrier protein] reductase